MDYNFDIKKGPVYVKFFEGGKLNVSYNCLDKNLKTRANKVAIQFEGNEPGDDRAITYKRSTRKSASSPMSSRPRALRRVTWSAIYLPMIPELAIAMLACTRIGAIHSIVFGGFSSDALRDRIQDSKSQAARDLRRHLPRRQGRSPEGRMPTQRSSRIAPRSRSMIVVKRVGDKIKCTWTAGQRHLVG